MARARQCDRCGKYYNVSQTDKVLIIAYRSNNHEIRRRDLCEECYVKLNDFLDKPKEDSE